MPALVKKVARFTGRVFQDFKDTSQFSVAYASYRMCRTLCSRIGLHTLATWAENKKAKWIDNYLSECLQPVWDRFLSDQEFGEFQDNAPIWVCWWTGEDTAPSLVQRCIRSIRENAGPHPVHFITAENYSTYLEIPDFLLKKLSDNQIGPAHFADYIRVKLLAEHGGLWLDATIFCSAQVPELCFAHPFFTCKSPKTHCPYLSEMRWTTFCLGGWKGNVFYRFLTAAFETYWQKAPCAIDYLFFDHIINLAIQNIPSAAQLLDAVPENNLHRDDLQAAMNASLPASVFNTILQTDTTLYKLSWRENYASQNEAGEPTVYAYFLSC